MYRKELDDNNNKSKIVDKFLKFFKKIIGLLVYVLKKIFYAIKTWLLKKTDNFNSINFKTLDKTLNNKSDKTLNKALYKTLDTIFDKSSQFIIFVRANLKLVIPISFTLILVVVLLGFRNNDSSLSSSTLDAELVEKSNKIATKKSKVGRIKSNKTEEDNAKTDKSKEKSNSLKNKAKSIYELAIEKYDIKNFNFFNNFQRTFHDLNSKHLAAAKKYGIKKPDTDEEVKSNWKLRKIETCDEYKVDKLTYSMPYLVPRAVNLLQAIAENFQDSLYEKGFPEARIILTSVLRTKEDVRRLRKRNGNASANSSHMYGTTFDIAYTRFDCEEEIPSKMFKAVLAEVLNNLRKENKCYIVYEYKQCCFHITTR